MEPGEMNVTNMVWQPALLRLTTMPHPEVDDAKPTPCYVAPQWIMSIERKCYQMSKMGAFDEKHPVQVATYVALSATMGFFVMESPETVAMMRDRAMGHEQKPRSV